MKERKGESGETVDHKERRKHMDDEKEESRDIRSLGLNLFLIITIGSNENNKKKRLQLGSNYLYPKIYAFVVHQPTCLSYLDQPESA